MGNRKRDIRATVNTDEFLDMPAKAQLLYFHCEFRESDAWEFARASGMKNMRNRRIRRQICFWIYFR